MRRRSILAASAASVLCLCTILAGTALANPAGGIKGDPQPDHKPFRIAAASTVGGIALNGNSAIVAYGVTGIHNKIVVCAIKLGQRKCSYKTVIATPDGGTLGPGGVTGVFRPSAGHIAVLQNTCCDNDTNGDTLLYNSTNDGKSFGAPVRVGNIGVGAAVLIGHDIVFIVGDVFGTHVESIPDSASGPPGSTAKLTPTQAVDVGVGDESGALIAGYDTLTSDYTTYVDYAAAGANFNAAASYHKVATFKHEQLLAVSGDAVLTRQTTGKQAALLRFCHSNGCGSAHRVPGPNNAGPNAFGVFQNPNGVTHVFSSGTYVGPLYDLMDLSTSNGTRWSMLDLGNGINSTTFTGALDNLGAGLVLGSTPAWGYPVLVPQAVSFNLKSSTLSRGKSTVGSGHVSPADPGRTVTLQIERSGLWHIVATTHESSSGSFSFKIKGSHTGTFRYRAVASDLVGYFLYGYSRDRSLTVTR